MENKSFPATEYMNIEALLSWVQRNYPEINPESQDYSTLVLLLEEKRRMGYSYESAEASFILLVRKFFGGLPNFFELESYKVIDQLVHGEKSVIATLKISFKNTVKLVAAEGNGPVNALDNALREALIDFYPMLHNVHLQDYKVHSLESSDGTGARVRVLITSGDGAAQWTTIGVSTDIIKASWEALESSIVYKLDANYTSSQC